MMDFGEAHERFLAAYHTGFTDVWCSNRKCDNHDQGQSIRYEVEYGQATYMPPECDKCGASWLNEAPATEDEEDEY